MASTSAATTVVADPAGTEPTRRHLTDRQVDTVQRLVDAAVTEVAATGYDGLTVRNVAKAAGVAPATAYNYFASKDHLVAEVFARQLADLVEPKVDQRRSEPARVTAALAAVGELLTREPQLAAAATIALLAKDPDVVRLRTRIGALLDRRLSGALGPDIDPAVLRTLNLAWSGAMLQAGMGYFGYDELSDRMEEVATMIFGGAR